MREDWRKAENDVIYNYIKLDKAPNEKYGKFTGIQLSAITHQKGSPWSKTWEVNPWGAIPDFEIDNYYKELLASV